MPAAGGCGWPRTPAVTSPSPTLPYPELRGLGAAAGSRQLVLDGEIVAFDGGRPSDRPDQGHRIGQDAVRSTSRRSAPRASAMRRRVFSVGFADPRSILLMSAWSIPVATASSACVMPRRSRSSMSWTAMSYAPANNYDLYW